MSKNDTHPFQNLQVYCKLIFYNIAYLRVFVTYGAGSGRGSVVVPGAVADDDAAVQGHGRGAADFGRHARRELVGRVDEPGRHEHRVILDLAVGLAVELGRVDLALVGGDGRTRQGLREGHAVGPAVERLAVLVEDGEVVDLPVAVGDGVVAVAVVRDLELHDESAVLLLDGQLLDDVVEAEGRVRRHNLAAVRTGSRERDANACAKGGRGHRHCGKGDSADCKGKRRDKGISFHDNHS